ncbi:MAG: anti-sigma factor RsbA family regulatory protein [Acidimicrobiales bacterium]
MSWTATATSPVTEGTHYRHEAFFYADRDEFLDVALGFIRDASDAGQPILVVLDPEKNSELRCRLRGGSSPVMFADMCEMGKNPARIIPAWIDFVNTNAGPGVRARGIGEPIVPGQSPAKLVECQRHEALLNIAIADPTFWLLCPYDTSVLDPEIIHEARRTHSMINEQGCARGSETFAGAGAFCAPSRDGLPDPPRNTPVLHFRDGDLSLLRHHVASVADRAGITPARKEDLVLATNEITTNSLRHGGGAGTLRSWTDGGSVVCEVRDDGVITDPLAGRRRPLMSDDGGRGLWLTNQLCDLVQIRVLDGGNVVRLHVGTVT